MKTLLTYTVVLAITAEALAASPVVVDPTIEVPVSTIQAQLETLQPGATRKQVEESLGPGWRILVSMGGAGCNTVTYHNVKFPGFGIHICYRYLSRGAYREAPEDPVRFVGRLYRFDRQPVE